MQHTNIFREIVTDQVTTRVAIESRAGKPCGLVNRRFETITGELIMADWEKLAKKTIQQVVLEICGIYKPTKTRKRTRRN